MPQQLQLSLILPNAIWGDFLNAIYPNTISDAQ